MGINAPGYSNKKSLIWPWNSRILYRRKKSRNDVILAQLLSKVKGKCKLPWNRLFCSLHKLLSSASKDLGQSTSFIMDSLACDVKFHNLWASSIPGSPNREAMSSDLLDSLKRLWWCRLCLAEKLRMIPIDVILNLFCKMIHRVMGKNFSLKKTYFIANGDGRIDKTVISCNGNLYANWFR